jgi:hypothetical protein
MLDWGCNWYPYEKKRSFLQRQRLPERTPGEDRGRDWGARTVNQGAQRIVGNYQKLGKAHRVPSRPQRDQVPALNSIFTFLPVDLKDKALQCHTPLGWQCLVRAILAMPSELMGGKEE